MACQRVSVYRQSIASCCAEKKKGHPHSSCSPRYIKVGGKKLWKAVAIHGRYKNWLADGKRHMKEDFTALLLNLLYHLARVDNISSVPKLSMNFRWICLVAARKFVWRFTRSGCGRPQEQSRIRNTRSKIQIRCGSSEREWSTSVSLRRRLLTTRRFF